MANLRFLKMAAVRQLGFVSRVWATQEEYLIVFVIMQNLVIIGAVVLIIYKF